MPTHETRQRVSMTLKWSVSYTNQGKYAGGGILNDTSHIENETWVEIMDDPSDAGTTGRLQLHIGSTRCSFEELGVFLLALARYRPPEPGYSCSFDLTDQQGKPVLHLVVHLPEESADYRPKFVQIHVGGHGVVGENGAIEDRSLPIHEPFLPLPVRDALDMEALRAEGRLEAFRQALKCQGNETEIIQALRRAMSDTVNQPRAMMDGYLEGLQDAIMLITPQKQD